jgi:hypothetical protein
VGFLLWASWVVPLYTSCVLRGAFRFFNKFLLKKKKKLNLITVFISISTYMCPVT